MIAAVESYIALRRAVGYSMRDADRILRSYGRFADARGDRHALVETKKLSILRYKARTLNKRLRFGVIIRDCDLSFCVCCCLRILRGRTRRRWDDWGSGCHRLTRGCCRWRRVCNAPNFKRLCFSNRKM